MAFDITNPATYDDGFKTLLRQKGYAGRKDVSVDELEALYVDYSGKQEQDTKVATNLLSSVAADPAPYTGAMANQDTFQGDQSFDLTQMNNQGGSGPIFSTVQAVDEQEALKRQQAEQVAAQPDPMDEFRMVAQERLLPAIDAIKQQRAAASNEQNTWKRRMNVEQVDQLAATRINDLVASGVINSQDADLIQKRADESKGLTYEESLRRFLFDRMNPQQQQQAEAGVSVDSQTSEALKVAVDVYKAAESAAELRSDDPAARRAAEDAYKTVQNVKRKAGLSVDANPVEDYKKVLRDVKFLQNAQNDDLPRVTLNDQVIEGNNYGDALLGLQTQLGTIMASPEFREKLPVIDKATFEDPKDYQAAIREAGQLYLDENGQVVTPDIFTEKEKKARFTTFKPTENETVPDAAPEAGSTVDGLSRAQNNMIRRMIQEGKGSTNTNFKPTPEMISSVREEMNEEQIESALRSLYAGNSWASQVGLRNPMVKDEDLSGVLGRTDDAEAAKFLSEIDPETVKRVYEKADRLQGFSARGLRNEDGSWSQKVDTPEKVLSRIRALASKRGK